MADGVMVVFKTHWGIHRSACPGGLLPTGLIAGKRLLEARADNIRSECVQAGGVAKRVVIGVVI